MEPRQPSVRGARDRPEGQRQGARHRPRPPADLARPQADADGSVAAGARELPGGRRRLRQGDEGRHVRRVRRDPPGRRGPRPHLGARAAPRRESARGRLAGRHGQRAHPRGRRRAAPPLALAQARRGWHAHPAGAGRGCAAAALDLSEDVFSDETAAAQDARGAGPETATPTSRAPGARGSSPEAARGGSAEEARRAPTSPPRAADEADGARPTPTRSNACGR